MTDKFAATGETLAQRDRTSTEKRAADANRHRELPAQERTEIGNLPQSDAKKAPAMRLVPTQSPGRGTRKARDFGAEIVQLRAQGYTLEAIRTALADAGVLVTISTVWREANRVSLPPSVKPIAQPAAPSALPPLPSTTQSPPAASVAPDTAQKVHVRRNGREVAEVFMRGQITNALIRSQDQR